MTKVTKLQELKRKIKFPIVVPKGYADPGKTCLQVNLGKSTEFVSRIPRINIREKGEQYSSVGETVNPFNAFVVLVDSFN